MKDIFKLIFLMGSAKKILHYFEFGLYQAHTIPSPYKLSTAQPRKWADLGLFRHWGHEPTHIT